MSFYLIAPKDVSKYVGHKKILFVDIRDKDEYLAAHIEDAIYIPYEELEERAEMLKNYRMLIIYCDRGNKSLLAARMLNNKGFRVGSIVGGFEACQLYL